MQQIQSQKVQKEAIFEAKRRVEQIVRFLKDLEKRQGSTEKSRHAIQTMESFLKCYVSNPVIYRKYFEVTSLLEKYANVK